MTSSNEVLYDVSHGLTSSNEVLYDISHWLFMTSAIGWRHEKRFFMTSAISWCHEKRFFMTSAIGWRHEDISQWLRDKAQVSNQPARGSSPCSNAASYFAGDFLLGPNVYKRHWYSCIENVGMKQRMHHFYTAFILLQFPWRNKLHHVHHAENRTRGISFWKARIRESRWQ